MEKLIELLNEYETEKFKNGMIEAGMSKEEADKLYPCSTRYSDMIYEDKLNIISKKFGFIKWLVDNDKIDLEKLDEKAERKPQYTFIDDDGRLGFKLFEVYDSLLMLLAIQENPIEFLCSVLI